MNSHRQDIAPITGVPISLEAAKEASNELKLEPSHDLTKHLHYYPEMQLHSLYGVQTQLTAQDLLQQLSANHALDSTSGGGKGKRKYKKRERIESDLDHIKRTRKFSPRFKELVNMIGASYEDGVGSCSSGKIKSTNTKKEPKHTHGSQPVHEVGSVFYHEVFGVMTPFQTQEKEDESIDVGEEEILDISKPRIKQEDETQYACNDCEKTFSRKEHLSSHVETHTAFPPNKCVPCDKVFSRREHYLDHSAWHARSHTCSGCGKAFSRKEHLTRHSTSGCTSSDPTRARAMSCHLCGKSFTRREHYVNHVRWHSGESPHVCTICHKAFTRKEHLRNHVRQHTGESPHQCKYCGRTFSRKEHLINHTRQHTGETPFRCEICPKAFARKDHLLNHTRLHSRHFMYEPRVSVETVPNNESAVNGTGHHSCSVCGKTFSLKSNLLLHTRQSHNML